MRIEEEAQDWRCYYELTEAERQAGLDWLRATGGLNYQYSDEELDFLKIYDPTDEQIDGFEAALASA